MRSLRIIWSLFPRRRWVWRSIGLSALFAALVGTGFALTRAPWRDGADALARAAGFETRIINIHGARPDYTPTPQALGLEVGASWFNTDLAAARAKAETSPWVRSASARFIYPGQVHINIVPAQAQAWVRNPNGQLRVALNNGAFAPAGDVPNGAHLPLTLGPVSPQAAATLADDLQTFNALRERLRFAQRINQRRWNLTFDNGIVALLPAHNQAHALQQLASLITNSDLFSRDIERIDLRLPRKTVARLRPGSELSPDEATASPHNPPGNNSRSPSTAHSDVSHSMRPRASSGESGRLARARSP